MPFKSRVPAQPSSRVEKSARERIIEAAYEVFKLYDINKATIEDIAKQAKLSRATVYKNFDSKAALLYHISELELQRINHEIREAVAHIKGFAEKLTEALVVATRIAQKNNYTHRVFDSIEAASRAVNPRENSYKIIRESWQPFLERGWTTGELSRNLDLDDVVVWLTLSLMMMYVRLVTLNLNEDQIRAYFARFVVQPLLADPSFVKQAVQNRRGAAPTLNRPRSDD